MPPTPPSSSKIASLPLRDLETQGHAWLLTGEIDQHSSRTLAARRDILAKLLWFLRQREFHQCGLAELRAFLHYCSHGHTEPGGRWGNPRMTKPVRPRTVHTYHGHLRTFFTWLVTEEILDASPMDRIPIPDKRSDQIIPFTHEQIEALQQAARSGPFPRRDRALILFLLDTGVRASEPLFANRCSEPLTRSGLLQIIERLGKTAGIVAARCSPHTFRHTFAIEFLRDGGDVFTLQQMLGHTSLDMTRRYAAIAQADIETQHRRHSPVERMRRLRQK